jgi:hypothetical protein
MSNTDKTRENRLRQKLHRGGRYALKKDRSRSWSLQHQGGYMIVDNTQNFIVAGEWFHLTLNDVENWLKS